jgi:hypothetical protein
MIIVTLVLCTATLFICFYYLGKLSRKLDRAIKDADYLANTAELRAQNVETRLDKLVKNLYTTVLESKKQFLKNVNHEQ